LEGAEALELAVLRPKHGACVFAVGHCFYLSRRRRSDRRRPSWRRRRPLGKLQATFFTGPGAAAPVRRSILDGGRRAGRATGVADRRGGAAAARRGSAPWRRDERRAWRGRRDDPALDPRRGEISPTGCDPAR